MALESSLLAVHPVVFSVTLKLVCLVSSHNLGGLWLCLVSRQAVVVALAMYSHKLVPLSSNVVTKYVSFNLNLFFVNLKYNVSRNLQKRSQKLLRGGRLFRPLELVKS